MPSSLARKSLQDFGFGCSGVLSTTSLISSSISSSPISSSSSITPSSISPSLRSQLGAAGAVHCLLPSRIGPHSDDAIERPITCAARLHLFGPDGTDWGSSLLLPIGGLVCTDRAWFRSSGQRSEG